MTTVSNTTTNQLLFNVAKPLHNPELIRTIIRDELVESLVLCRITQVRLSTLGKNDVLMDTVRQSIHTCAESIRQFDRKVCNKIPDIEVRKEFQSELQKEKLLDIGDMITLAMEISSKQDYDSYIYLLTQFLNKLVHAQRKATSLNFNKYKALMELLTSELKADTEGGISMFDYCEETKKVTVQMVHPNTIIDAKATI